MKKVSENKMSVQIDNFSYGDIYLTLAKWQPDPEYSGSFEIGYRNKKVDGSFSLIQWSAQMSHLKIWEIVKRLVLKKRPYLQIIKVLERLDK